MLLQVHGWIPDLLETQLENLGVLWSQWMEARRSPEWTLFGLRRHEERINAHIDALVLAGTQADELVGGALGAGFWSDDLASASVILHGGRAEPHETLLGYFRGVDPEERNGVVQALRMCPIDPMLEPLRRHASEDDEELGAASALALVSHGHPMPQPGRLPFWRQSQEPRVAAWGWEITAHLPRRDLEKIGFSEYKPALESPDAGLREAALRTGAVGGADWARAFARDHVQDPVALRWLGILGEPGDLPTFIKLLGRQDLGPARFAAAASYGHPGVLEPLLQAMRSDDALIAVSAGLAFTRITGQDVGSDERVAVPDPDVDEDDEFEADFVAEEYLPDPARAKAHWDRNRKDLSAGTRWAAGSDLGASGALLTDELDLLSRWEEQVRRMYRGERGREFSALGHFPLDR